MAGIYFHIPFCKKACHYCDFHFSTSLKYKEDMLMALEKEILMRKEYLQQEPIETIYFGGGTPSILEIGEIKRLLDVVFENFEVDNNAEITLEANPDDLLALKVFEFRNSPINRFSIGIQSFFEDDLKWMNRAHNAQEADAAVKRVQDAGFENITVDLIFGFPLLSEAKWNQNIKKTIALQVPHISAYSMAVEPDTALGKFIKKGIEKPMDDSQSAHQFIKISEELTKHGYDHYEISSYSFPGHHSRHNSNYWKGIPYLGIGPSAHSFNGQNRHWNMRNNALYMKSIGKNEFPSEEEILTETNKLNEYILTSLRMKTGIDLDYIENRFGADASHHLHTHAQKYLDTQKLAIVANRMILTLDGKLYADYIASELFMTE